MEHPGTPAVYDTGVESAADGSSRVWLVMQLLRGATLEALLDRADFTAQAHASGTVPTVSWAAVIAAQIAAVLADVHRVDIVHRDIKPSNVSPPPSVRARRTGVPTAVDLLVTLMLAKDASVRPCAQDVYAALLPFALAESTTGPIAMGNLPGSDPTRPFRRPLLAAQGRAAETAADRAPLTDAEAKLLLGNVDALLQAQHPAEAIGLLEDAAGRAPDAALALELRRALAAALFYAGEYTRAATLFDAVGSDYRRYLPAADPLILECAYHAGHAYAEVGKPDKARPQLRYYIQNADPGLDADEAEKVIDSRFLVAQMLAAAGDLDAAVVELQELRPLLATTFGENSTQVRNLEKQLGRLLAPNR